MTQIGSISLHQHSFDPFGHSIKTDETTQADEETYLKTFNRIKGITLQEDGCQYLVQIGEDQKWIDDDENFPFPEDVKAFWIKMGKLVEVNKRINKVFSYECDDLEWDRKCREAITNYLFCISLIIFRRPLISCSNIKILV